ncbi:MAG: hypothetical protein MJY97_01400 [Bacteroidales bacterium]|nr:hypothetical protein [Bacteroidales bacterium]
MSEYTCVFLRRKNEPSDEADNGCLLFYLTTTPSRQLDVLPWSPDPQLLTADMLQTIIEFYSTEIEDWEGILKRNNEELIVLENRIRCADVKLYDKINQEIYDIRSRDTGCIETLEELRGLRGRFEFVEKMMHYEGNAEYELIYTKA